jgi:hypothetical protein
MSRVVDKRLLLVWLGLSAITVLQLWLSSVNGQAEMTPNATVTIGVIAMALIKVRIIVREFMEVRHAPVLLCRLTDAWMVITGLALLGVYLIGMNMH